MEGRSPRPGSDAGELVEARSGSVIRIGRHEVRLPEGVSLADWSLEKVSRQNPRIRALLGCIRLLDGVRESNYAILHCSPERLQDIWSRVRRVAHLIRHEIAPRLETPSSIPRLEVARKSVRTSLAMISENILVELEEVPDEVPPDRLLAVRKLLCVSIGQLHSFLLDSFGELMTADPRSRHDADYFLSRRFPRDIEEAEWLHTSVERLREYMTLLLGGAESPLARLAVRLLREGTLPDNRVWSEVRRFVGELLDGLTPRLKGVLALRGVRFDELEIIDRYAVEIPLQSRLLLEIETAGRGAAEAIEKAVGPERQSREQSVRDLEVCHALFSRRLAMVAAEIDRALQDLRAFVPIWLSGIQLRRALMLRKGPEDRQFG